jgi:ketosteroid isomerase-like protein
MLVRMPIVAHVAAGLMTRVRVGSEVRKRLLSWVVGTAFAAASRQDVDPFLAIYEPGVEVGVTGLEATGVRERYRGHEGVREFFADADEGFGEWGWTVLALADGGDRLAVRCDLYARGRASGVPTTVKSAGMAYFLSSRGRVAKQNVYMEDGGWTKALEAAGLSE